MVVSDTNIDNSNLIINKKKYLLKVLTLNIVDINSGSST
jgi:hypothetical protein